MLNLKEIGNKVLLVTPMGEFEVQYVVKDLWVITRSARGWQRSFMVTADEAAQVQRALNAVSVQR